MKCPKCGYLGFEAVDRCRHCGYDFPAAPVRELPELPLRASSGDAAGLLDLEFDAPGRTRPAQDMPLGAGAPRAAADTGPDLPLFGDTDARPFAARPAPPRPPLAVRRASPEIPRARIEPPRTPMLDLPPADDRSAPAQVPRRLDPDPRSASPATGRDAGSLVARIAAGTADLLLLGFIDVLVVYFTLQICGLGPGDVDQLPKVPLGAFLLLQNAGYLVAFTAAGQTLGKMAAGLRVVRARDGGQPSVGSAALRAVAWSLSALPAGLGFVPVLVDAERRGWHDRLAGTAVVRAR